MDDLTNRILIVGFALIGIFLVFLVILLAWGAPDNSIDLMFDLANYVEDHNNTEAKLIITFGGVILMLVATLIIIFEVVPPEANALVVSRASTGDAQIEADEVVMRIEDELRSLPQINQVQATVVGRGKKTEVDLSLHVSSDANLAATVDEAGQRTRALMEDRMGLELSRPPRTEIQYRELRMDAARPAAKPEPDRSSSPPATASDSPTGAAQAQPNPAGGATPPPASMTPSTPPTPPNLGGAAERPAEEPSASADPTESTPSERTTDT